MGNILDNPEASDFIHNMAREIGDEYAGLDIERVVNVLARTLSDIHGRPLTKWPKVKRFADSRLKLLPPVWFSPSIIEALQYLPPADALDLFESEDLELLRTRQLYTSYLSSGEAPLYSIKQCANAINGLLKHQRENREALLDTGYPRTVFNGSALLTQQMVEVYPVRWPSEVREEAGEYVYTWSMARWHEDGPECAYEEAPLAPELGLKEAARLESLRGRLYDARVEVLLTIGRCIRTNDPEALWRESEAVLAESLSADEIYFLLGIDSNHTGFQLTHPKSPLSENGALSALFGLVGHCEEELTIGAMAKTRKEIDNLVRNNERGCPYLIFDSYYEVVGKAEQQKVEVACDMLAQLEEQEAQFWDEYEQRVNSALAENIKTEASATKQPKPGYRSGYKTALGTYGPIPLMTAEEISELLRVHPKTIYQMAREGTIPCRHIGKAGKAVRFVWSEVDEALRAEAERNVETRRKDRG